MGVASERFCFIFFTGLLVGEWICFCFMEVEVKNALDLGVRESFGGTFSSDPLPAALILADLRRSLPVTVGGSLAFVGGIL